MKKYIILLLTFSTIILGNELLCVNPQKYIQEDKAQKSTFQNCKRNGMTWWYTESGKVKSQVNFIDGKENGTYISFYDTYTISTKIHRNTIKSKNPGSNRRRDYGTGYSRPKRRITKNDRKRHHPQSFYFWRQKKQRCNDTNEPRFSS